MTSKRAISTEDLLIWTYQRQKADLIIDRGVGLYDAEQAAAGIEPARSSADGCAAVARNAAIGATIQGSKASGALQPDAETVHERVSRLSKIHAILLLEFGRTGMAPDWLPGARVERQLMRKANGEPMKLWDEKRKHCLGYRYHERVICADGSILDGGWGRIDFAREVYLQWHSALVALGGLLAEGLLQHRCTGPSAKLRPWDVAA